MSKIIITRQLLYNKNFIVYIEMDSDNNIVNLELFNDDNPSILYNVYVGRVENIVKNINSAFVRISSEQNCYMSLKHSSKYIYCKKNSKKEELCIGDEILVQVIKDAVKTKDPVVSPKLTLHGKYSILTTENTSMSVSKKISKDSADKLRSMIIEKYPNNEELGFGILIRTNGEHISSEELLNDIDSLYDKYNNIMNKCVHYDLYSKVFESLKDYILKLNSVRIDNIKNIITDQTDIYNELKNLYEDKLTLYYDKLSINALYSINSQLEKLTNQKVWLKSGANIIIEQLETLTVIDVNTAKNIINKTDMLSINKEAAKEIIRQLRLRNISGMIIIDFINMKSEEEQNSLIAYIKDLIKSDDKTCSYIDITKLGLIELTRKKTSKSLKEQLT